MIEYKILNKIKTADDIKSIPREELELLAKEIRHFIVNTISKNSGHLASNLGVVEIKIALHRVLDLPKDKIIFDVGHQSLIHKILSGRKDKFDTLRQFNGISGFPKREESEFDTFNTGHSSTSISAGLGFVKSRDLKGEDSYIVSVIGDGSMTGGLAYEALNNAAILKTNYIIILNDNNMSIDKNIGGMNKYFNAIRTSTSYQGLKQDVKSVLNKLPLGSHIAKGISDTKNSIKQFVVPGMLFENMGIKYLGPVDGHNEKLLEEYINEAKKVKGPVLIHAFTKKGKGYKYAEENPTKFHGIGPFNVQTGEVLAKSMESNTSVFANKLIKLADNNGKIIAITAAMPDGTGLGKFKEKYPDRYIDVGIAESHGVTFAAGLACEGFVPVFAIYSSFLQRGFDQVIHDVALQNLHVVFAIDRAGIVGRDGETHQGLFDISYFMMIPNVCLLASKNKSELETMLEFAVSYNGPIAIRYTRGEAYSGLSDFNADIELGKSEVLYDGNKVCLIAYGSEVKVAVKVREKLLEQGISTSVINLRFAKPLDTDMLNRVSKNHDIIVTMEEGIISGGVGSAIENFYSKNNINVNLLKIGIDDEFVMAGSQDELYKYCKIDCDSIVDKILKFSNLNK